jgi:hypothetical protein
MVDTPDNTRAALEIQVTLSFLGRDLDPDMLTELLGFAPDSIRRRGQPYAARFPDRLSAFGAWHLQSRLASTASLEAQILDILGRLPTDPALWRRLTGDYQARLFVGVFLNTGNQGFNLSSDLMARLANYSLPLAFDIYAPIE